MTTLFPPPQSYSLPLSWHGDLVVDFQNFDPDDAALDPPVETPLDYETGVQGFLDIKTPNGNDDFIRVEAVINGNHAVCRIESEVCDPIKNGKVWVFLLRYPSDPTTEVPVVNGVVERRDGT